MSNTLQNCLWDILESEACEKYYIDDAELPGFLVLSKWNLLSHGGFELYMNRLSRLGRYRTKKELREKLRFVFSTAKKPLSYYKVDKQGRRKLVAQADGHGKLTFCDLGK